MQASLAAHANRIPPNVIFSSERLQDSLEAQAEARRAQARQRRTGQDDRSKSATPWYLSHCLFLAILMIRTLRRGNKRMMPWWLTFSPLFLSAGTVMLLKASESYLVLKNRSASPHVSSFRVHCALVDHVGYTLTVVATCMFLSCYLVPDVLTACAPMMITSGASLVLRVINLPSLQSRVVGQLFISSFMNCAIHTIVRIIFPLLLLLKLDCYAEYPWTVVAIPVWVLCFGCFMAMLVLLYLACTLHAHANATLRLHVTKLMLLCAFQLFVISVCGFFSSYWLARDLEEGITIEKLTCVKIFLPLLGICLTVAVCYPLTLNSSSRYHDLLRAATPMYMDLQGALRVKFEEVAPHSAWLVQESDSLYRRVSPERNLGMDEEKLRTFLVPFVNNDAVVLRRSSEVDIETGLGGVEESSPEDTVDGGIELRKTADCSSLEMELAALDDVTDGDDSRLSLSSCTTNSSSLSVIDVLIDSHRRGWGEVEAENSGVVEDIIRTPPDAEGHLCIICCDHPADSCFMECGHGNVCYECAMVVARKLPSRCPICRVPIETIFKLTHCVALVGCDDGDMIKKCAIELSSEICSEEVLSTQSLSEQREEELVGSGGNACDLLEALKAGERLVLSEKAVKVVHAPFHPFPAPFAEPSTAEEEV